jgi:hypothetical protein
MDSLNCFSTKTLSMTVMYPLLGDHAGGGTLRPSTHAAICETARENCELLTQPLHARYTTTPSAVARKAAVRIPTPKQ